MSVLPPVANVAVSQRVELLRSTEASGPNLLCFGRNDDGNAQRVIALYGESIRYCHAFKKWLVWDGRRWVIDETEQARQIARFAMIDLLRQAVASGRGEDAKHDEEESDSPGARWRNFASYSLNAGPITNMLTMARSQLVIRPAQLDTDPYLLNFLNGTVDLRTGTLLPHRREDFITKLVHYNYCPGAPCPLWRAFLHGVLGSDKQVVAYLQRALGYSLTGCTIEKAVFVLFGEGNNGKSTLLSAFRQLLDEYAALLQVDSLMMRRDSANIQADLADLRAARFVMTSESEDGARLAQGKLKRITQGMGKIKATRKYENPIEFSETHKLWMDTNRRPAINDADDKATFSRLHPIPFTVSIAKDRIDRELPGKLLQEGEGILAWAVEGAKLWHRHGLDKPTVVELANEQWRAESDWLECFIQDRCTSGGHVMGEELFQAYRQWAESNGERQCPKQQFAVKVSSRAGISKKHTDRGTKYEGIQLRPKRPSRVGSLGVYET
jgi:putative DNA primase/helicase